MYNNSISNKMGNKHGRAHTTHLLILMLYNSSNHRIRV